MQALPAPIIRNTVQGRRAGKISWKKRKSDRNAGGCGFSTKFFQPSGLAEQRTGTEVDLNIDLAGGNGDVVLRESYADLACAQVRCVP